MNNSKPKLLTAEDSAAVLKVLAGFAPVSAALIERHIAALEAQRDAAKLVVDTNRATNQYHEDRRAHAERRSHALEAQNQQLREVLRKAGNRLETIDVDFNIPSDSVLEEIDTLLAIFRGEVS